MSYVPTLSPTKAVRIEYPAHFAVPILFPFGGRTLSSDADILTLNSSFESVRGKRERQRKRERERRRREGERERERERNRDRVPGKVEVNE